MSDTSMTETDRLFENAPCGLFSISPDGRIRRANNTFARWLDVDPEALTGALFASLLDPGSLSLFETQYLPALELAGEINEVPLVLRRAHGEGLSVLLNARLVGAAGDSGDEPAAIVAAVVDSTQREDYERQLVAAHRGAEAAEARTRSLEAASAAFARSETADDLAQAIAESFKGAFAAGEVAVHFAEEGILRLAAGSQPFEVPRLVERMRIRDTLLHVGIDDPVDPGDPEAEVSVALQAAQLEELTLTPLLQGDRLVGTVACFYDEARDPDSARAELHYALARQAEQVLRRIRLQNQLEAIALYDPLTGAANRTLLRTRLTTALADSEREHQPITVLFVDLDGFKEINDLFDHSAGDDVLRVIAGRVAASVRPDDLVARFGGDEFLVVCENTGADTALLIADRLRESIKQPLLGIADERAITASIGVAVHVPTGGSPLAPLEVFRSADAAMYDAKNGGKDRVTIMSI
ncbi:MAG: diguanylate cyclase [Actinomycetales bacterium]